MSFYNSGFAQFMPNTEQQKKLKRYKTTLWHNYEKTGMCSMGDKWHFAHGEQELRKINEPIPIYAVPLYQKNTNTIPTGWVKNNYKTVYCKFYMQDGHCSFGDRCTYAHGEEDIRPTMIPASMVNQDVDMSQNDGIDVDDGRQGSSRRNETGESQDQLGYSIKDNQMFDMIHGPDQQESAVELLMKLNDDSLDTKRSIYEIVKWLKSQNYEEAKKLVTVLHGNLSHLINLSIINFKQISSYFMW